jgi:hypothetical protein
LLQNLTQSFTALFCYADASEKYFSALKASFIPYHDKWHSPHFLCDDDWLMRTEHNKCSVFGDFFTAGNCHTKA